ncbi:hypothetical protein TNCV_350941 [Trichonephila clavipes]|nr:hypothetical protein TNCV_350941 [Trichonephila clavipes]
MTPIKEKVQCVLWFHKTKSPSNFQCKFRRCYGVSEGRLTSHCSATRGLLATDLVILNHGQVTRMTPKLAPPLLTTIPHQRGRSYGSKPPGAKSIKRRYETLRKNATKRIFPEVASRI